MDVGGFFAAHGYAVGGNGYPFAVFDAAVQFHHQGGIQIRNLNQADVFRARFLQGFVERLRVFAVYQHIEPEAFMVRHQRAADFGVAQVGAGENLPAYRIAHLRINAVRIFEYQIFITDFALPHGKTVAYCLAERDKLFEYAVFRQNGIGKGCLKTGLIPQDMAARFGRGGVEIQHHKPDARPHQEGRQIAYHQRGQSEKQAAAAFGLRRPMGLFIVGHGLGVN